MAPGIVRRIASVMGVVTALGWFAASTSLLAQMSIAGRVLDENGKPGRGVRVRVFGCTHPELPPSCVEALGEDATTSLEVVTNESGVFRTELPHLGPFTLLATSEDGRRSPVRFPVMAGDFVSTELGVPNFVAGRVLTATGEPAALVVVSESGYGDSSLGVQRYARFVEPSSTITDAAGLFRLPMNDSDPRGWGLALRSIRATRTGPEPQHGSLPNLYRIDGQSIDNIELRLGAALAPRISVVSDKRRMLRARILGPDGIGARRNVLLTTMQIDAQPPASRAWLAATDEDGRLDVTHTADSPIYGFAEHDGAYRRIFAVDPPAEGSDLGTLRIGLGRTLSGVVVDQDRVPRAGALVMLHSAIDDLAMDSPSGDTQWRPTRMTYTNASGRFRFDHVPSNRQAIVVQAGLDGIHVTTTDDDMGPIPIALEPAHSRQVHLTLADGTPASNAQVQFVVTAPEDPILARFRVLYLFGHADAEGHATFRGLPKSVGFTIWGTCVKDGRAFIASLTGSSVGSESKEPLKLVLAPHDGKL